MSATAETLDLSVFAGVEMPTNGSKYSHQERYNTVVMFLVYGNQRKVSEVTGIPQDTIYGWSRTEWWQQLLTKVKEEKHAEFNAGFSRIIEKSIDTIEEQLNNQEVRALDAAKIMGIAFDKRQIMNNQPTSIQGKASSINDLQQEFERYVNAKEITLETRQDSESQQDDK